MANPFTSAQAPASQQPSAAMQLIAPDLSSQQLSNARMQQMAQMLRQNGMAPGNPTQIVSGRAVKQAPIEGLSRLAQVLAGTYMQQKGDEDNLALQKAYAQRLAQAASGNFGQPQGASTPATTPNSTEGISGVGGEFAGAEDTPPKNIAMAQALTGQPGAVQGQPLMPQQPNSPNRFNLNNLIQGQAVEALGGDNAGKTFWSDKAATEMEKQNRYLGIDKGTARQNELAKQTVAGTQNMRGGSTIRMPDGTMFTAPDQDSGVMLNWQDGKPSLQMIPGAQQALSIKSQAAQEGKNRATPASPEFLPRNADGTYIPATVDQVVQGAQPTGAVSQNGFAGKVPAEFVQAESAAASKNGLPSNFLPAIRQIESSNTFGATNKNNNGSIDKGIYQINSVHGGLNGDDPSHAAGIASQAYKKANGDPVLASIYYHGGLNTDPNSAENQRYANKFISAYGNLPNQGVAQPASSVPQQPKGAGVPFGMEDSVKGNVKLANDTYTNLVTTNSTAPTVINALDNVSKFAKGAITGGLSEQRQFANSIFALVPGLDSAKTAQEKTALFDKAASRLVLAGTSSASATDALRVLAQAASPNSHMPEPAIQEAVSEIRSLVQMNLDNQKILQSDKAGNNVNAVNSKHLDFSTNADPRLWTLKNMQPAERKAYWSHLSEGERNSLLKKGRIIEELGGLQ